MTAGLLQHTGLVLEKHKSPSKYLREISIPKKLVYPLTYPRDITLHPKVVQGQSVSKNQILARAVYPYPMTLHASTSGTIESITPNHLYLLSDNKDKGSPLPKETPLSDFGLQGLGGAIFPTAKKWEGPVSTLIVNAVECEPYICCDESLVANASELLVEYLLTIQKHFGLSKILFAIEDNKPMAIAKIKEALKHTTIELRLVPERYPHGAEKILIQLLTGQEISSDTSPLRHGIVCQNVATVYALGEALSLQQPLIRRLVTFAKEGCSESINAWVRFGTPLQHCLDELNVTLDSKNTFTVGGNMMFHPVEIDKAVIQPDTNCFLQQKLSMPQTTRPCIRCGACHEVCPVHLLPQQLYANHHLQQTEPLQSYQIMDCIECGCCDLVCPSRIPLTETFRATKNRVRTHLNELSSQNASKARYEARIERLEQKKAALAERRRQKKASLSIRETLDKARAQKNNEGEES